ncbi:maleylpyruvate isomerase family mycothiol-dependent enzyme [Actinocorallia populi]|uniref:maleylpyruvate isomerase family mycothiol-dependent enzyme n=1 Tax=Actinocorallia populi TaxID=2079200 RepID=UPI0018E57EBC|nr:maleylpyruvate isomerase family mycothiol-dependent enzyme [Actinocorallia populi]
MQDRSWTDLNVSSVLAEVVAAQSRLERTVAGLDEAAVRAPSPLEGWTRGHVLSHIARNADSYRRLLEWARTGVEHPQYPSAEAREAEIEAGAGRPAAEIAADVRESNARFVALAESLPQEAWDATVRALQGWAHPAWYTLHRRWREVEVHHVDLGAGYTPADWPGSYVRAELTDSLRSLRGELPFSRVTATDLGLTVRLHDDGPALEDEGHHLLAWLTGRASASRITAPPPRWPAVPVFDGSQVL